MAVRAIGEYRFPSRSRVELYGDDQLVHVWWRDNTFLCSAATFRVPKSMPFGEFVGTVVEPWAASDPDFVPGSERDWHLDEHPLAVDETATLTDLGIGHKHTVSFVAG
ncbi:phenol hydroxylase subunit P4 [Mycolicibacterium phlei]|uniref:phenol hydroxylase subunit P4 n=1 Tax=Mycolicibacterium phlei TaxID=1771 RepID=UPI0037C9A637